MKSKESKCHAYAQHARSGKGVVVPGEVFSSKEGRGRGEDTRAGEGEKS